MDRHAGHRSVQGGPGQLQAFQLLGPNSAFIALLGAASPGAMQQQVLNASPGYYVEACFMDTQDGREHTQLGMVRLVQVVVPGS